MGLAATIIQDPTNNPSEKKQRASRIFLLLKVDKYRYVIKKFNELTNEPNEESAIAKSATSVLPVLVYFVRDEKGVTNAHPGKTSALSVITLNLLDKSNKNDHSACIIL